MLSTPANSSYNELVIEAGRMSILNGGRPVVIEYGKKPGVKFKEYLEIAAGGFPIGISSRHRPNKALQRQGAKLWPARFFAGIMDEAGGKPSRGR